MFIHEIDYKSGDIRYYITLDELKIKNYFNIYNYYRSIGEQSYWYIENLLRGYSNKSKTRSNSEIKFIKKKLEETEYQRFMTDQIIPDIIFRTNISKPYGIIDNLGILDYEKIIFRTRTIVKNHRMLYWNKEQMSKSLILKDNLKKIKIGKLKEQLEMCFLSNAINYTKIKVCKYDEIIGYKKGRDLANTIISIP